MTKILLISISFLFGTCLKTVPTIKMDSPLSPDSTIIVIPVDSVHRSDASFFLRNDLLSAYRLPTTVSWKVFGVLRPQYINSSLYPDTTGRTVISIGNTTLSNDSDMKGLPPASFIIKKKGRLIAIRGVDDAGDFAGVEYFLSHYCGVTHYMPGTLFTKYPNDSTISLPEVIDVVDTPFTRNITSTGFWGTGNPSDPHNIQYWDNYWALLNSLNYTDWGSFQHTMSGLFDDSLIMKFYPDVYPMINGKRYFPTSANDPDFEPYFSAPDLVDASFDIAVNYFTKNPSLNTIAFSVMDGAGGYLLKGQAEIDANATWLNGLAKRMPNKTIAYLSYSQVEGVPSFKLEPNVLPITVYHLSDFPSDGWGRIDNLAKVSNRTGNDDWAEGKGFIMPRIYTRILSQYLTTLQKNNIKFDYAHIEAYPNWGLDGIKYWEMGQLYRNPNLNVDSIRMKFCTDLFGEANKQMKSYFDALEDIGTYLNNTGIGTHMYNYPQQLFLDSTRMVLVSNCRSYLNAAANLATTQDEKDRVQFFNTGFTMIEGFWNKYNLKDSIDLKGYIKNNVSGTDRILFSGTDSNYVNSLYNLINSIK